MPFDISGLSYSTTERHHYTGNYFNVKISGRIIGAGNINWAGASGQQSCAIRMSIALAYAGVSWQPRTRNSWRLSGTNVYFPSLASDYPDVPLLFNPVSVTQATLQALNQRGVIYFGGNFGTASGHLTLWDGSSCHHNDAYWDQPNIYFWRMS